MRTPLVTPATATPEQAALLARTPPIRLFGLLAHTPGLAARVAALGAAVMGSDLDPLLRELIALRVAVRLGATYVEGQHRRVADMLGMTAGQVEAAIDVAADVAPTPQGDILRLADHVAAATPLDTGLASRLEATHGAADLVGMTVVAGYFMMLSGVTRAFDLALDDLPQA